MFESLTKHLPAIENAEGFGNWVVDRESKGTMDDPIKMPYVNYGTTVADVEQAIYDFVDEHPEYELAHYRNILEPTDSSGTARQCLGQMYRNSTAKR